MSETDYFLPWRVSEVPFGTAIVVDARHRIIAAMKKEDEHIARFIVQRANDAQLT